MDTVEDKKSSRTCTGTCCDTANKWADTDEQSACMKCAEGWSRRIASFRRTQVLPSGSAAAEEVRGPGSNSAACVGNGLGIHALSRSSSIGCQSGHPKLVRHSVPLLESKRMQTQSDNSCTSIEPVWGSAPRCKSHSFELESSRNRVHCSPISCAEGGALITECIDSACTILFCDARTCLQHARARCSCTGPDICTRNILAQDNHCML